MNQAKLLNATKMEDGTEICPVITATYYKDGVHNFLFAPQYRKPCVIEIQDETEYEGEKYVYDE